MAISAGGNQRDAGYGAARQWRVDRPHGWPVQSWWSRHREASLNWLALGLLLAAWNASDNDAAGKARGTFHTMYSLQALRLQTHLPSTVM